MAKGSCTHINQDRKVVQTFCESPVDTPAPLILEARTLSDAINVYITLLNLRFHNLREIDLILRSHLEKQSPSLLDTQVFVYSVAYKDSLSDLLVQSVRRLRKESKAQGSTGANITGWLKV